jgi:hypothetical protein
MLEFLMKSFNVFCNFWVSVNSDSSAGVGDIVGWDVQAILTNKVGINIIFTKDL